MISPSSLRSRFVERSMRSSLLVIGLVVPLLVTTRAGAQTSLYDGLPEGVAAVGRAIETGDANTILAELPASGTVVRTAYSGSGGDVPSETARTEIAAAIISSPNQSDARGSGRYSVLAVWRPNVNPRQTLIVGSGIGSDGARLSTAFTVEQRDGDWSIVAYGRIFDLDATLQQWAGQGDLRLVSAGAPTAPATGDGQASPPEGRAPFMAGTAVAALGALLWAATGRARSTTRR